MKPDTIIRTIVLVIALVNQILTACGKGIIPIEEETVNQLITAGFTVVTALAAWWRNNSFTLEAQRADEYLQELRDKPIE